MKEKIEDWLCALLLCACVSLNTVASCQLAYAEKLQKTEREREHLTSYQVNRKEVNMLIGSLLFYFKTGTTNI